ncbi:hypothetical protein QUB47_10470 [Microcoleus sp. AT9_B5]
MLCHVGTGPKACSTRNCLIVERAGKPVPHGSQRARKPVPDGRDLCDRT